MDETKAERDYRHEAKRLYEAWWKALPDSRLKDESRRRLVPGPLGMMTDAYCVNCHKPYGLVTMDFLDHVLVVCPACDAKHGRLPLMQVPDAIERANTHP
jgi:hypothetical protein